MEMGSKWSCADDTNNLDWSYLVEWHFQLYSQSRPYTKPESLPYFLGVHKSFILGLTIFLLYINDLPDDVICNIVSYADDTTVFCKCDQASALWQQLELDAELESDLWDTGLGQEVACSFQWRNLIDNFLFYNCQFSVLHIYLL